VFIRYIEFIDAAYYYPADTYKHNNCRHK